jgi:hypothetical protein
MGNDVADAYAGTVGCIRGLCELLIQLADWKFEKLKDLSDIRECLGNHDVGNSQHNI